jgi:oligopeptide transport system substrate-binding protein
MRSTGQRRGRVTVAAVGLVAVGFLLGCQPDTVDEPDEAPVDVDEPAPEEDVDAGLGPQAGGTLRIGLVVDPVSLDPRFVVDDEGELLIDALFDPLIRLDEAGRPQPAAAERWEVDDDGTTFRFELRPATFHDGTPVTAADFKRTFDRIADGTADPPSFFAYLLDGVVGIEEAQLDGGALDGVVVEDDRTLRIELTAPHPSFLLTLADPSLVPTPPSVDEDLEAYAAQPIGNGPFAMAGPREPGAFIRIVRHEEHHEPPLLDEVLFTLYDPTDGEAAQWSDLVDGQLQIAQLAPSRRDEAIELFGASTDGYRGPGVLDGVRSPVYLYGFDVTRAPFDDARLRRAISLAIDREVLATETTEGTRIPATSLVPPGIPGAQPGACDVCVLDPERARDLLDEVVRDLVEAARDEAAEETDEEGGGSEEAGTEDDGADDEDADEDADEEEPAELPAASEVIGPITLTYSRGVFHGAIAERIAEDLQDVLGLEVDFQAQELGAFIQGVRRGDTPVFRLGWDATEPDPASYLYPLFHSSQIGLDNLTRYADDEVDALLDEARESAEPGERRRLLRAAERAVLGDLPAIPVLWYRHDVVVRPEVRDLRYSPLGRLSLSQAWLDESA